MDRDKSGSIDFHEFCGWFAQSQVALNGVFNGKDGTPA